MGIFKQSIFTPNDSSNKELGFITPSSNLYTLSIKTRAAISPEDKT